MNYEWDYATPELKIKKLTDTAVIPQYQTDGASGFDLYADATIDIEPGQTVLIPTGLAFQFPKGYEVQIRPRSGLSLKTNLSITNSPGSIDSDYTGQIGIIMKNDAYLLVDSERNIIYPETITIEKGTRIAQAVFTKICIPTIVPVDELEETTRNSGGFGSTGTK